MHTFTRPVEFVPSAPITLSQSFYQRLCDFYDRQPAAVTSDIWTGCLTYNKALIEALRTGPEAVEAELMQLYDGGRVTGLDWNTAMYQPHGDWLEIVQREFERVAFALASSLGVIRAHNPEQSSPEVWDAEELIGACEKVLGIRLDHPGGGKMVGASIGGRFIPYKMLHHAVTLATIQRLHPHGDILEIGAGCGFLVYLLRQAYPVGVRVETIDLPEVTVIQAFLLECAGLAPQFSNEIVTRTQVQGFKYELVGKVLLNGTVLRPGTRFSLVVNQDSLPEIPGEVAHEYLRHATERTWDGARLLSVNHESSHGEQSPVRVLMADFPEWTLKQRSPYWGRAGWIEEVWER